MAPTDRDRDGASPWVPPRADVDELREAARDCRGCDLWEEATSTVFGRGPGRARIMLIGEQPGDHEDRTGEPFVGPAGRILDRALADAGIDRSDVYLTNAVKHFRHDTRGGKRIHRKPSLAQITACGPWLRAEIATIRPDVVVLLGATAARAVLGPGGDRGIMTRRGTFVDAPLEADVLLTVHPSSILRVREASERADASAALADDLRTAAGALRR
jgi:uracil-DNA glycosylase family protein